MPQAILCYQQDRKQFCGLLRKDIKKFDFHRLPGLDEFFIYTVRTINFKNNIISGANFDYINHDMMAYDI